MSRIDDIFAALRAEGRTALCPFITAGYPSLEVTEHAIPAIEAAGASIVELGIPFSDPIADGPVIASSMHEALLGGTTPDRVFDMVRRIRASTELGLVAMVSDSIVARHGPERFVEQAAESGIDGLIVPDVDTDAAEPLAELARAADMSFSLLVAPTTPDERIGRITALCSGFVYVLARAGLTGEREAAPDVAGLVQRLRPHTELPLAVGFGVSRPEHVTAVTGVADAAIVGSALVRRMGSSDDPVRSAAAFVAELGGGLQPAVR